MDKSPFWPSIIRPGQLSLFFCVRRDRISNFLFDHKHVTNWVSWKFFLFLFLSNITHIWMQINLSRHGNMYGPLPIGQFMKYKEGWLSAASIVFERNFLLLFFLFFFFFFFVRKIFERNLTLQKREKKKKLSIFFYSDFDYTHTYRRIICMVAKKNLLFSLVELLNTIIDSQYVKLNFII